MKKLFIILILCFPFISKGVCLYDSLTSRKIYTEKGCSNIGAYCWGGFGYLQQGKSIGEFVSIFPGVLTLYEKFIANQISLSAGIAVLQSWNKYGTGNVRIVTAPILIKYYPKFLGNNLNINLCLASGHIKYSSSDSGQKYINQFLGSSINVGLGLNLQPKKIFKKTNNHLVFEYNGGFPIINLTKRDPIPFGGLGIKYIF